MGDGNAQLRRAALDDAVEITRLSAQLGYPLAPAEMSRRLTVVLPSDRHYVAVAASGERLLGWMHVEHRFSLEGGDRAELMGLVVDASVRRGGIGRALVSAAESWALSRSLPALTVRSNAEREHSHPFYEALGYAREKTQHVYRKTLTLER